MIATADDWRRLSKAVGDRMGDLSIGPSDIEALGGPSGKSLGRYLKGTPIKRTDVKRRLCQALGWSPNSIDRIIAGKTPVVVTDDPKKAPAAGGSPQSVMPLLGVMPLLDLLDGRMSEVESSLSAILEALRAAGIEVHPSRRNQDGSGMTPTSP